VIDYSNNMTMKQNENIKDSKALGNDAKTHYLLCKLLGKEKLTICTLADFKTKQDEKNTTT